MSNYEQPGQRISHGVFCTADVSDQEVKRLEVNSPTDDLGDFRGFHPKQIIVIRLDGESLTNKVIGEPLDGIEDTVSLLFNRRPFGRLV